MGSAQEWRSSHLLSFVLRHDAERRAAAGHIKNDDPTSIDPTAAARSRKLWKADIAIWTVARSCCLLSGAILSPMLTASHETPATPAGVFLFQKPIEFVHAIHMRAGPF